MVYNYCGKNCKLPNLCGAKEYQKRIGFCFECLMRPHCKAKTALATEKCPEGKW